MRTAFPSFDMLALGVGTGGNLEVVGGRRPNPRVRDEDTLYLAAWLALYTGRWMIPSYNQLPFSRHAPGGYLKVALGIGRGELQAVGLGADNQIYQAARQDSARNWHPGDDKPLVGLPFSVTDIVADVDHNGTLQVVCLTGVQLIYRATELDNQTGKWSHDSPLLGHDGWKWNAIAMANGGDNLLQVVGLASDNRVYQVAYQDSGGRWPAGSTASLRPNWEWLQIALGKANDGALQVVGLGLDHRAYLAAYQGGSDWHQGRDMPLGPRGVEFDSLAVGIGNHRSLEVIGIGTDRMIYRAAWQKDSGWNVGSSTPLSSRTYRHVALGSNRNDDLEIVGLGDDGDLYVVGWQDSSGKWHQSRSLSQKNDTGRRNSTQLIDAFEAFKAVPDTYTELDYYTPSVAEDILGHFQGMARHDQFYLLTHDRYLPGPAHGLIYVLDRDSKKEVIEFDTPEKDYRHPGGCQVVGDYLGVELELQNPDNDAVVRFYWLGSMCDRQPPTLLPSRYVVPRSTGGSSAIAVTDIGPRDKPSYVMALATKQGITIFTANDCLLDDPELSFTERFTLPTDKYPVIDKIHHGPDNINLVTDARGLYLISLGGNDDKNIIVDWADLYKVDFLQEQLVFLQTKHIITSGGGQLGVHFRFGAGSWVESPSQLYLYGCARNISGFDPKPRKMLPVNEFIPEQHPGGDRR